MTNLQGKTGCYGCLQRVLADAWHLIWPVKALTWAWLQEAKMNSNKYRQKQNKGGESINFSGSVADEQIANSCVEAVTNEFGKLDYLINNADTEFSDHRNYTEKAWSDMYDTNVKGTFLFSKAVLTPMKKLAADILSMWLLM
jgi:NAD(P)-dependent dehydrogenase (short-subunit alcohol dehydrogenase family)